MRRWAWAAVFAVGSVVYGKVGATTWRDAHDASWSDDNLHRAAGIVGSGVALGAAVLAAGMLSLLVWQARPRASGSSPDHRFGIGTLCWLLALLPMWSLPTSEAMPDLPAWPLWIWLLGGLWLSVATLHLVQCVMSTAFEPTSGELPNVLVLWAPPALMCACVTAIYSIAS